LECPRAGHWRKKRRSWSLMMVPGAVPSDRPTEILSFTLMLGAFKAAQKTLSHTKAGAPAKTPICAFGHTACFGTAIPSLR